MVCMIGGNNTQETSAVFPYADIALKQTREDAIGTSNASSALAPRCRITPPACLSLHTNLGRELPAGVGGRAEPQRTDRHLMIPHLSSRISFGPYCPIL